jgi:hypothetical protein
MKLKFIIICIFISTFASAQIIEEKGSVETGDGIVLNGTIGYYFDHPTDILIRENNGLKHTYNARDVKIINLDNGKRFNSLPFLQNDTINQLIVQCLIESEKISLFMRNENGNPVFYVSKNNVLYRLENNESIYRLNKTESAMDRDGNHYKVMDHQYLGVLNFLMSDQPELYKKREKLELKESDLTEIITLYNKGNISYYWKSDNKFNREPYWSVFTQYSHYCTYNSEITASHSYCIAMGAQYYFSKSSRTALKYSFDYSDCHFEGYDETSFNLAFRFSYDFVSSEYYKLYFMLHVADLSHISHTDLENSENNDTHFTVSPRFSPGFGLEIKFAKRLSGYTEINSLFQMEYLPRNYSFGIKYRLVK